MIDEALVADIPDIHRIRMSVRENILGDPGRVMPSDIQAMIETHGKGWVYRVDGAIRGFSFADRRNRNIWALFVEPEFDRKGIGRPLHDRAVGWLFEQGSGDIWLATEPGTRAERFYEIAGWQKTDMEPNGDCLMVLARENWRQ